MKLLELRGRIKPKFPTKYVRSNINTEEPASSTPPPPSAGPCGPTNSGGTSILAGKPRIDKFFGGQRGNVK